MTVYNHEEYTHDLKSPRLIVPILKSMFDPRSVIDVGCGIGTFLYAFKELGIEEVLGLDGEWAKWELVQKYLERNEFINHDLTEVYKPRKRYDLAICLEVAEHIPAEKGRALIETLVQSSDRIIFSAAIPLQGGQNHINEQWPDYWQKAFFAHGYVFRDVFRDILWDNGDVHWWYRQNMFLVEKADEKQLHLITRRVHPELFLLKARELEDLKRSGAPYGWYLKRMLKKIIS